MLKFVSVYLNELRMRYQNTGLRRKLLRRNRKFKQDGLRLKTASERWGVIQGLRYQEDAQGGGSDQPLPKQARYFASCHATPDTQCDQPSLNPDKNSSITDSLSPS
jgi:hypothetical protein